ncbi:F-box domain-containing protein [Mycena sanguinolenta]|uniref:F-box domain-containing protein n=1 Tax=Mycena sanguinolenta TaxID=230812 RepID=A0A8H6YT67_9AGAR|nr:F-box domain-containing protein [Mycena sanguinolenta]
MPHSSFHSMLELVNNRSHQWREIVLGRDVPLSLLPVDGKYPFLESITMHYTFPPSPDSPILSFRDAPRLHDVHMMIYTTRIELPWHQLTRFRTDEIDIEDCLELLRRSYNLADAQLKIPMFGSSALPTDTIILPQLQSLYLSGPWHDEGGQDHDQAAQTIPTALLKCLKTPALKTLILGFMDCRSTVCDISPFLSFSSQSPFQLHTLKLFFVPATVDALIDCLKATPTLIHLQLQISRHILDLNPLFAKFTGPSDFLPKLESLHVALIVNPSIVDAALVLSALVWRCISAPEVRLKNFRFTVSTGFRDYDEYFNSIKSHSVYAILEASETDLYIGKKTKEYSFM